MSGVRSAVLVAVVVMVIVMATVKLVLSAGRVGAAVRSRSAIRKRWSERSLHCNSFARFAVRFRLAVALAVAVGLTHPSLTPWLHVSPKPARHSCETRVLHSTIPFSSPHTAQAMVRSCRLFAIAP